MREFDIPLEPEPVRSRGGWKHLRTVMGTKGLGTRERRRCVCVGGGGQGGICLAGASYRQIQGNAAHQLLTYCITSDISFKKWGRKKGKICPDVWLGAIVRGSRVFARSSYSDIQHYRCCFIAVS